MGPKDYPSLTGKTCLVTGGTSGGGAATARGLARLGARVVLVGRDRARGEAVVTEIAAATGNRDLELLFADLSLQSGIRELAAAVERRFPRVDVLVHAAGVLLPTRRVTAEGIEATLAVDYLAHFLLTHLLLARLAASSPARILVVAGGAGVIRRTALDLDALQSPREYNGFAAAMRAAVARTLFVHDLGPRLAGSGVTLNAFHPGIVQSQLGRDLPLPLRAVMALARPLMSRECRPAVHLAASPGVAGISGRLFVGTRPVDLGPRFADQAFQRALRERTLQLCGLDGESPAVPDRC